jgi:biopolymer transport protein ExbD
MILYLIKSVTCLLILLLVHRLILQREAIYQFNRFYLLAAVIGSFLIPMVEIEVPAEAAIPPQQLLQEFDFSADYQEITFQEAEGMPVFQPMEVEKELDLSLILWVGYGLITLIFFIRFVRNISLLVDKINNNVHIGYRGETVVLLKTESLPFSFLSYIFVSKGYFENNQLTEEIFVHEQAHVHGRHSWDNLLIESLLVVFWFHPGLYFARQAIKLNHEFIADQAALQITPLDQYKSFLLRMMLPDKSPGLASSLNFSLTKKRFAMMKRSTANSTKWIMILGVIPVLAALVYIFSEKVTAQAGDERNSNSIKNNEEISSPEKEINILLRADGIIEIDGQLIEFAQLSEVISSKNDEFTLARISANSEVEMGFLADIQEILRKNEIRRVVYEANTTKKDEENDVYYFISGSPFQSLTKAEYYSETKFQVKYPDGELEEFTYGELPEKYKKDLPSPPGEISKKVPSLELFESWKNGEEFALWLDGKVVPNSKLDELEVSDIAYYTSSFVHSNARSERFPQNYQVGIYTLSGFENTFGKNSNFGKKPMGGTITIREVSPKNKKITGNFSKVSNQFIPTRQSYQKEAAEFQLRINGNRLFSKLTDEEFTDLQEQYRALDASYQKLPLEEKRKVNRANFPYAKIEREGKVIYKKMEDLTPEELKELGC